MDEDGYFSEEVAARYDESSAEMFAPAVVDAAADVLAELAGGGRALELGIGTGHIALPLAHRGVRVHGIDISRAMVARLRACSCASGGRGGRGNRSPAKADSTCRSGRNRYRASKAAMMSLT
jgi:SAM-dependent methyltransferase